MSSDAVGLSLVSFDRSLDIGVCLEQGITDWP
ncbi:MAG: hypothetical protein ACI8S6_002843, partial [Myxococcota bacterium]